MEFHQLIVPHNILILVILLSLIGDLLVIDLLNDPAILNTLIIHLMMRIIDLELSLLLLLSIQGSTNAFDHLFVLFLELELLLQCLRYPLLIELGLVLQLLLELFLAVEQ